MERHRLNADAIAHLELDSATRRELIEIGVPIEIRLDGWLSPTLFTSELGYGRVRMLAALRRVADERDFDLAVIGTIRETQLASSDAYSAFCIAPGGELRVIDLGSERRDTFVNSSVTTFRASLEAFVTWWRADDIEAIRGQLSSIDPRAMADEDHYWPVWLEDLEFLAQD